MDDDELGVSNERVAQSRSRAWIEEKGDDEEILDLLSSNANRKILSANPFRQKLAKEKRDSAFNTAADGRLIIGEPSSDSNAAQIARHSAKKRSKDDAEFDDEVHDELDDDQGDERSEPAVKYQHGGQGIHRDTSSRTAVPVKRRTQQHQAPSRAERELKTGKEYRSRKAKGDMTKHGMPAPHAYYPLQMQALNKRKRAKYAGQFNNMMSAAKRGAQMGSKNKHHGKRTKN